MNNQLLLIWPLVAGMAIGTFFFGGLWWTVKKGLASKIPALWFIGSLLIRTGVTLVGFYIVSANHWERMLVCLIGFVVARVIVTRITKPQELKQTH